MIEGGADDGEYRRIGEELLASWNAGQGSEFTARRRGRGRTWTTAQLAVVHSLAAHVHRLYAPATRLLDEGWIVESMPLIRSAYEAALTAQWVAQTNDGVNAFVNEDVRKRNQLERTAQAGVPDSIRGAASIPHIDLEPLETSAAGSARNFEQLCSDLTPGGASAYFPYRVLSMHSHPSLASVDDYLDTNDAGHLTGMRLDPNQPERLPWRGIAVSSLVWAGRAVDFFDEANRRRSQLRHAATSLGIESALQLTEPARRRQSGAGRV